MARLNRIWRCTTISFTSKIKLYKSLFTSILLYGCEAWTLLADSEKKRILAFETKCLRKLLPISHFKHKTSDWMRSKINFLLGRQEVFWQLSRDSKKLAWFGHVTRHDSFFKTILQGIIEGGRRCGRHRKCWMDNIKEWTSLSTSELLTRASCRKHWRRISAESFLMFSARPN